VSADARSADPPSDWDAVAYHRVSGPMETMALAVLDRLPLAGDETVLDAGCGTGRATLHLVDRLPRGRVIAVDRSPAMVEQARRVLAGRADVRQADLLELELEEPADAVFSTATFHWIPDHERLFSRLRAPLRPGGRLVAQCGGAGNIAAVLAAADEVASGPEHASAFAGWRRGSYFAGAEETAARLTYAGFAPVRCWLQPNPIVPDDPLDYLTTIVLKEHLNRIGPERRAAFATRVLTLLPNPVTVDYVRLNIDAVATAR
jgi:trans-aconitate 2-methyltransferase